jgi:hypothetical protein
VYSHQARLLLWQQHTTDELMIVLRSVLRRGTCATVVKLINLDLLIHYHTYCTMCPSLLPAFGTAVECLVTRAALKGTQHLGVEYGSPRWIELSPLILRSLYALLPAQEYNHIT